MSEENQKPKVGVGVMIFKGGKVLLGKRRGKHGDGEYCFPGGGLEYLQSFEECAIEETLEEAGIGIKNIQFLGIANLCNRYDRQDIGVFFKADWESGEPRDMPEERIGEWGWYDLDSLPEPLFHPTRMNIDSYKTGKNFYDKE